MPPHFKKVIQNFICQNCQKGIKGNGYTNHCPFCLYSKHVDQLIPGDRQSNCNSLMKPIGILIKSGKPIIFHQCLKCQKITRCKTAPNDNPQKLIRLSQNPVKLKWHRIKNGTCKLTFSLI